MEIMSSEEAPSPSNSLKSIGRKLGLNCCFPSAAAKPITFNPVSGFPGAPFKSKSADSIFGSRSSLAESFSGISSRIAQYFPRSTFRKRQHLYTGKSNEKSHLLENGNESSSSSSTETENQPDRNQFSDDEQIGDRIRPIPPSHRRTGKKKANTPRCRTYPSQDGAGIRGSYYDDQNHKQNLAQGVNLESGDSAEMNPLHITKESETGMPSTPSEMAWTAHTPPPEFLNKDERRLWHQMTQLSHERFSQALVKLQQYFVSVTAPIEVKMDPVIRTTEIP